MQPNGRTAKDIVVGFYEDFDRGELAGFEAVDGSFEATVFGTTRLDWPGFVGFGQSFVDAFPTGVTSSTTWWPRATPSPPSAATGAATRAR